MFLENLPRSSQENLTEFTNIKIKKKNQQVFFFFKQFCQHILVKKILETNKFLENLPSLSKKFFKQFFRFKNLLKSTNCNENPILLQIFITHWLNFKLQNLVSFFHIDIRFSSVVNEGHSVDTPFYNLHLTNIKGKAVILHQGHDHNFHN